MKNKPNLFAAPARHYFFMLKFGKNKNELNLASCSEDVVNNAKKRLAENKLDESISLFSKAIRMSSKPDLKALEGRIVCWERTGQLDKALIDAKLLIDEYPMAAQGYLRSGKILRLMGRVDEAIAVYIRGLEKVREGEKLRREIERQLYVLNPQLQSSTISQLSYDVAKHMVTYVQDPKHIAFSSRLFYTAFKAASRSSAFLTINSKLKADQVKRLLVDSEADCLIIQGPVALKNVLLSVKAGIQVAVKSCTFENCVQVDPFELSRAFSLHFLKSVTRLTIIGQTSDVLLSYLLTRLKYIQGLFIRDLDTSLPDTVELPRLDQFVCINSPHCKWPAGISHDICNMNTYFIDSVTNAVMARRVGRIYVESMTELEEKLSGRKEINFLDLILAPQNQIQLVLGDFDIPKIIISNCTSFADSHSVKLKEVYLKNCLVDDIPWSKFMNLNTVWLEGCINGISESCVSELALNPNVREVVVYNSSFRNPSAQATLLNMASKLKVLGVVECGWATGVTFWPSNTNTILVRDKDEFEFIKKKRWDVWELTRKQQSQS